MGSLESQAQLGDSNLFSSFTGIEMDKYVVLRWVICRVSLSDLDNADNSFWTSKLINYIYMKFWTWFTL